MTGAVRVEVRSGVAHVVLDVPGRPVNVLTTDVIEDLVAATGDAARRAGVRALVIRSSKESGFCAGADVEAIGSVKDRAEGARLAAFGQAAYAAIERLPVPVVAAVHGPCLGGGLELALACRAIVAANEPKTKLGLPETQLGIIPGFGGTQRLPRKVGLLSALDLILTGRQLSAKKALAIELADDIVCPFKLVEAAEAHALALAGGRVRRPRRRSLMSRAFDHWPLRAVALGSARKKTLAKTRGHYPALERALDVIPLAFGVDRARGFEVEAAAVGELLAGEVSHRLVELFLRMEELKRRGGKERAVGPGDRACVVGAGVMGAAIARQIAKRGARVRLVDVAPEGLAKGMAGLARDFEKDVRQGRSSRHEADRALDRVEPALAATGLARAAFALEAVVERADVKAKVFQSLEPALPAGALLLTNTSSLSVAALAGQVADPGRVVGLHFFNPVEKMPLVEVVAHERAAPAAVLRAIAIGRDLGKIPVVVKDLPGFLVNRVLAPYLAEALQLLEEGAEPRAIDEAMLDAGMAMGPLAVLDTVGLDVATAAAASLKDLLGERLAGAVVGVKLRDAGHLGDKSGGGIWFGRGTDRRPAPWLGAALDAARRERGTAARAHAPAELCDRMLFQLLGEAARAFADGVVADPRDADAGLVLGAGFPAFLGGPLFEIDRRGAAAVVARQRELAAACGPRFQPGDDLVARAATLRRFHGSN